MIAVKVYLTRINIEHHNSILLRSPCLKIDQIRDFHHLLPQQLHSLSFNNPDYRQQRMLFSNARNTAGSSEKSPSALSTILSKNNRAIGYRDISAGDAQGERKSHSPFVPLGL